MGQWWWLVDFEVLSGVIYHYDVFDDSQMLHHNNILDHLIALTLTSPTEVKVLSPPCIVCIGVGVILYICDSFYVKQACVDGVKIATSHTSYLLHLIHRLNRAVRGVYFQ